MLCGTVSFTGVLAGANQIDIWLNQSIVGDLASQTITENGLATTQRLSVSAISYVTPNDTVEIVFNNSGANRTVTSAWFYGARIR